MTEPNPQTENYEAQAQRPSKRYRFYALVAYIEEEETCNRKFDYGEIADAISIIMGCADACAPVQWNHLPMVGVLRLEEQWLDFQRSLAHLGASIALDSEDNPVRAEALKAMTHRLPRTAIETEDQ